MSTMLHDLLLHYNGSTSYIRTIDPDRYSYMDMVADCWEIVLGSIPAGNQMALNLYYAVPNSNTRVEVKSDENVLNMFDVHSENREIDLVVELNTQSTPLGTGQTSQINDVGEGIHRASSNRIDMENELTNTETQEPTHMLNDLPRNLDDFANVHWFGQSGTEYGDNSDYVQEAYLYSDSDEKKLSADDNEESQKNDDDNYFDSDGSLSGMSEYQSGDGHGSYSSDDQDVQAINADKYLQGKIFQNKEGEKITLEKGLLFDDVYHFRAVIKEFAIERGFQLVRIKNEKSRVTAHCGSRGCEWRIHASPLPDGITYKIKSIGGEHTCLRTERNAEATSNWIAQKFMKALRNNPLMSISTMHDEMIERFGLEATRMQLYRGKRKALDAIEGSHANSYTLLPKYAGELMKTNPGSLVKLELERILPNPHLPTFKRIFISLAAIQKGFKEGCRPFIGLDGCHLKGPFGGGLLAAVALDGNNGLFPLAVGVVESEFKESWRFFLYYLNTILDDGPQCKAWTIMSDGQKGIENALTEIMPEVTHRRCCRHLFNNFKAKFPGLKLRRSFWAACRAYTVLDFNSAMTQIREASELAYNWLMELPVAQWSRHAFDTRVKSDHVTNNLVESFNNWVGNIRGKPILAVLESIRCKLMEKLHSRFQKAITWKYLICPIIRKKLDEVQAQSRTCKINFAGQNEYQVREGISAFIVNLSFKTCCCRVWQVSGIPCKHAVACISHIRGNIENYCDEVYFKHVYFSAYGDIVHPIHDEGMWDDVPGDPVQPPPLRRLPGRPRKNRRREADEGAPGPSQYKRSSTVRCFICKEIGHNKRTCQRAPVRGRGNSTGTNKGNGAPHTIRGRGISTGGFTNTAGNEVFISQGSMYGSIRGRETPIRGRGVSVRGRGGFFRGRGMHGRTLVRGRGLTRERASLEGINLARGTNLESGSEMVGLPKGGSQAVAQSSEWSMN